MKEAGTSGAAEDRRPSAPSRDQRAEDQKLQELYDSDEATGSIAEAETSVVQKLA